MPYTAELSPLSLETRGYRTQWIARRLRQTRVIMLTARSAEAEVLEALELGAFDHVPKPFRVPVLMERVRRALRS